MSDIDKSTKHLTGKTYRKCQECCQELNDWKTNKYEQLVARKKLKF